MISTLPDAHHVSLLVENAGDAQYNMDKDALLFGQGKPIMRFYTWKEKSFSIGYFQSPQELRKMLSVEDKNCPIVRRITGGGIVEHGKDLTFSIVLCSPEKYGMGNVRESYSKINNIILSALPKREKQKKFQLHPLAYTLTRKEKTSYFCFQKPTLYDLMYNNIKIGGNAQRRSGNKLLHQGSIRIIFNETERKLFINEFYKEICRLLY